jgi:S1-C subfamily serine protease
VCWPPILFACLAFGATTAHPADPRLTPVLTTCEASTPAVVSIESEVPVQSPFFFGATRRATSDGSGVIIDARGRVLTIAHVLSHAITITAHGVGGQEWKAHVVGLDADLDRSVLQLKGANGLSPETRTTLA